MLSISHAGSASKGIRSAISTPGTLCPTAVITTVFPSNFSLGISAMCRVKVAPASFQPIPGFLWLRLGQDHPKEMPAFAVPAPCRAGTAPPSCSLRCPPRGHPLSHPSAVATGPAAPLQAISALTRYVSVPTTSPPLPPLLGITPDHPENENAPATFIVFDNPGASNDPLTKT